MQQTIMPQPIEYLAIRAWGEMMKSAPTYIMKEQEQAAETNAPIDSIYYGGRQWVTTRNLPNPDARRRMDERLIGLRMKTRG